MSSCDWTDSVFEIFLLLVCEQGCRREITKRLDGAARAFAIESDPAARVWPGDVRRIFVENSTVDGRQVFGLFAELNPWSTERIQMLSDRRLQGIIVYEGERLGTVPLIIQGPHLSLGLYDSEEAASAATDRLRDFAAALSGE